MNHQWKRVSLEEICKFKYGQMPKKTDLSDSGYPVFSGYRIVGLANSYHYEQPEVVVVARGVGGTGDVKFSPPKCFLTNLSIAAQVASPNVDKQFLFYRLNYPSLWELRTGSAQAQITIERLNRHEVDIPPLPTQRKIASILSAYDDLIENNTRRIAILESMAQAIYREWFVEFRFPGHEKVKLVDSPLGKIPEGWKAKHICDMTSYINRGVSPKYDDESNAIVINQKCIRGNVLDLTKARRHKTVVPADKLVRFGDVLVNSTGRGTLGRVAQVYTHPENWTVDSHVTITRPIDANSIDYLGFCILGLQQHFDHQGTGSTGQTELPRSVIGGTNVVVPELRTQSAFSFLVRPMRMQIISLSSKNINLRKTRDLLLPKLISGQLDVEDLEIETGEAITE
jgi:type I restriction enzyme S subunit